MNIENSHKQIIAYAIQQRKSLFDSRKTNALRLFNGFLEGYPDLVLELFADTLVIFDYSQKAHLSDTFVQEIIALAKVTYPSITAVVLKRRFATDSILKRGVLIQGENPASQIHENKVRYAIDLFLNQDASFYLDTRNLRLWIKENLQGRSVLNTFAYTGSLGVAAVAAGASKVIQTDVNSSYLDLTGRSLFVNGWQATRVEIMVEDFFHVIGQFKRERCLFDCVIIDPPFFAESNSGRVDLLGGGEGLVNKVRPLVGDGGYLVIVNNALYLPGVDFMVFLQLICSSGYLSIFEIIEVPEDVSGYPDTICTATPVDPSPFNHSTKIVILSVKRKDGLKANYGT